MRKPEEIKKRLERCKNGAHCNSCLSAYHCQVESDALAYIRELEAKVAEYEKPLVPMTLDEVIEKSKRVSDNVIWLEQPDEEYGYDDTECIPALLSNFSKLGASSIQYVKFLVWPKNVIVFPIIDELDYGETWRCWSRRPTDEERSAAEWKKT